MVDLIKVAAYVYPPYVYSCFQNYIMNSTECKYPGIEISLLYEQLITLKFLPEFLLSQNESHMLSMVANGEADISGITVSMAKKNFHFEIAHPVVEDKFVFAIFQSKQSSSIPNLLLSKCHWSVWLIFVTILILLILLKTYYETKWIPETRVVRRTFVHKLPILAWSFSFGIFLSVYSQELAVTLITPTSMVQPFNDMESFKDRIFNRNCKLVAYESDVENLFIVSSVYKEALNENKIVNLFQRIWRENRVFLVENEVQFVERIKSESCAYGVLWRTSTPMFEVLHNEFGFINIPEIPYSLYGYFYRPRMAYQKRLRLINSANSHGLYVYHLNRIVERYKHYVSFDVQTGAIQQPLKLYQLKDIFVLLCGGILVGIGLFVWNLFFEMKLKRRRHFWQPKQDCLVFDTV